MTSTDPEPLPIPFGTKADGSVHVWDATAYHRAFWAFLSKDGERRIVAVTYPSNEHRIATLYPGYPDAYLMQGYYRRATTGLSATSVSPDDKRYYAAYDWSVSTEAVNQWSWRNPFRENLAILSHQLEGDLGLWWLTVASEIEKQALYNVLSTVISRAWILFERWGEIPVGAVNLDGELLWRLALPEQMERHRLMCGMCDIPDFVRTFYDNTTAERFGGFNENQDIEGTGLEEFMDKYRVASAWMPDITAAPPWVPHVEIDAAVTAGLATQAEISTATRLWWRETFDTWDTVRNHYNLNFAQRHPRLFELPPAEEETA